MIFWNFLKSSLERFPTVQEVSWWRPEATYTGVWTNSRCQEAASQSVKVSDRKRSMLSGQAFSKSVEVGFASCTIWTGKGIDFVQQNILKSLLMPVLARLVSPVLYYLCDHYCREVPPNSTSVESAWHHPIINKTSLTFYHAQGFIFQKIDVTIEFTFQKIDVTIELYGFIHLRNKGTRNFVKKTLFCLWHSLRTNTYC